MHQPSTSIQRDGAGSKIGNHGKASVNRRAPGATSPEKQHEKPRRDEKPGRRPEFDQEYEGKTVKVILHNGTAVIGRVETSKYWLKIKAPGDKIIYVNKAYVVMIEPAE